MSYRVYDIEYNDLCVTHTHVDVLIRSVCILNDDLNRFQSMIKIRNCLQWSAIMIYIWNIYMKWRSIYNHLQSFGSILNFNIRSTTINHIVRTWTTSRTPDLCISFTLSHLIHHTILRNYSFAFIYLSLRCCVSCNNVQVVSNHFSSDTKYIT